MNDRTGTVLGIIAIILVIAFGAFVIGQRLKEDDQNRFHLRIGDKHEIVVK